MPISTGNHQSKTREEGTSTAEPALLGYLSLLVPLNNKYAMVQ